VTRAQATASSRTYLSAAVSDGRLVSPTGCLPFLPSPEHPTKSFSPLGSCSTPKRTAAERLIDPDALVFGRSLSSPRPRGSSRTRPHLAVKIRDAPRRDVDQGSQWGSRDWTQAQGCSCRPAWVVAEMVGGTDLEHMQMIVADANRPPT